MSCMQTSLYGLRVICSDAGSPSRPDQGKLVWTRKTTSRLPGWKTPAFFSTQHSDDAWTHHAYGPAGETYCEFAISPDGGTVISQALPSVPQPDLFALFTEPVMRSVFRARRIPSFHGAALARDGAAILLLGSKGAGKSTLAAILVQQGWSLLTDDLARVRQTDGRWAVTPGFPHLKLAPKTAEALGFDLATLERRWSAPEAPDDPVTNKFVLHCENGPRDDVPLRTVYVVGKRGAPGTPVRLEALPPIARLHSLIAHASEDPVFPAAPPTRETLEVAAGIVRSLDVKSVSVPQGIARDLDLSAL